MEEAKIMFYMLVCSVIVYLRFSSNKFIQNELKEMFGNCIKKDNFVRDCHCYENEQIRPPLGEIEPHFRIVSPIIPWKIIRSFKMQEFLVFFLSTSAYFHL